MPRRGGRGGSRRGGREKLASHGRFPTKKRRGRSSRRGPSQSSSQLPKRDMPELLDLEEFSHKPAISSMRYNSRRPGRLVDEIDYTDSHHDETMRKPLRNRPLVFVKAKEVYDPSAELFAKSKKITEDKFARQELLSIVQANETEETGEIDSDSELSHGEADGVSDDRNLDSGLDIEQDVLVGAENDVNAVSNLSKDLEIEQDVEAMEVDDKEVDDKEVDDEEVDDDKSGYLRTSRKSRIAEEEIPMHSLQIQDSEPQEVEFVVDSEPDEVLDEFPKESIAAILRKKFLKNDLSLDFVFKPDEPVDEGGVEYNPVLTIGKVSLSTKRDGNNNVTAELMAVDSLNKVTTKGFVDEHDPISFDSDDDDLDTNEAYQDYINQVMENMHDNSDYDDDEYESDTNFDIMAPQTDEEDISSGNADNDNVKSDEEEEKDPEYGFLPEDFEFDVSQVSVTNMRFGIKNQYYTKIQDLTENEFCWIDEDDLVEYVTLKGVKEHRIESFLKYITGGLYDEQPQEPDSSDVYISETSEEEQGADNLDDDEDNLSELVSFAKSLSKSFLGTDNMIPTETVRTKGKGKNKQLALDKYDLDTQIFESLQAQYQIHRERKKSKKNMRDEQKREQAIKNHDLTIKYPYSLHIKEIRNEFELFLHDSLRDTLSFPPLDPHGTKTLIKMAKYYNMKAMRCGPNGLKLYVKVSKFKGTYHYLPKYNEINHVLRQRPIFNRTDQKRPREEYTETDGNAKKDRSRGRNRNASKAHVREGDVVGAMAPEIGRDNIGRQLLEKLGWTAGQGLGTGDNIGINEPIKAIVKTTKAGLR